MAEKVVSVRLQARVEGFTAGMAKAKASVDDLTKAAAPSKADAFGKMADKAALAGVGVATAVGVAVKRFADFDQAMSAVRANSGATGASLEALRQAAVTMGADSQFSATEAAQGINEMAKAGILVNLVMCAFNLFPLPPLDGGRMLVSLLPHRLAYRYSRIEPYGFVILLVLLFSRVLDSVLWPAIALTIAPIASVFNVPILDLIRLGLH